MRQIGGVLFGKDEILVKLRFKGLNYHNFQIFYPSINIWSLLKKYSTDLSDFASVQSLRIAC